MLAVHVETLPLSRPFPAHLPDPVISVPERLRVGDWRADRASGELEGPGVTLRLEPKVADLLFLLAADPGQVVSRERLTEALWPGLVVGEDVLARTVFKLRQAFGDDAKAPRYVETIAKRGYRLVAEVALVDAAPSASDTAARPAAAPAPQRRRVAFATTALVAIAIAAVAAIAWRGSVPRPEPSVASLPEPGARSLVARADDFYFQFSRGDNEAAIELYERVLGLDPDDPAALSGLANALTQRAVRWPEPTDGTAVEFGQLGDALAHGHLAREPARRQLERARRLAERAVEVAPDSSAAHKALGFVRSAQGERDAALASHERAVELDPDAWGAMINIGDVLQIAGRDAEALPWFERAYDAMGRAYARNPVQIRPWHAALGVVIADRYRARGDAVAAEGWYRRVLALSPLDAGATRGLAALLRDGGDVAAADRLCAELATRAGTPDACATAAPPDR